MSYLKHVHWTIEPLELPQVIKHCSKCGQGAHFTNSEKFRVNANKKNLDIWLIYHCNKCKSTYNLTVYERIAPTELSTNELERYMTNNKALAKQVGFNQALHFKNKVSLDLAAVPFEVSGNPVSLEDSTSITIKCS